MVAVIREEKPDLSTCFAHYMEFHEARERVRQYERHNIEYFRAARERNEQKRDEEYAEYLRQREVIENRRGCIRVDAALEILIREHCATFQQEKYEQYLRNEQRHFHGCYGCAYAETDPEDLHAWCQKYSGVQPNLFSKCRHFQQAKE